MRTNIFDQYHNVEPYDYIEDDIMSIDAPTDDEDDSFEI